jgi:hypothetical protein
MGKAWDVYKTVLINKPPKVVYETLLKVEEWPVWDTDLISSKLDSPPTPGQSLDGISGTLHMRWGSQFKFTLQNSKQDENVEYFTPLPMGASAVWYWHLSQKEDQTEVKMGCTSKSWFWGLILKPLLGSAFTTCTENLKELIETGAVAPKPSKK